MTAGIRFQVRTLRLLARVNARALLYVCLLLGTMLGTSACLEPPGLSMEIIKHNDWKAPPHWSPERNSIVFSHGLGRNSLYEDLYEASADGSQVRVIPGIDPIGPNDLREQGTAASISPDLTRLTYADFEHNSWVPGLKHYDWEIVTSDPDGSDQRRLTNREGMEQSPVWSPDGSRIAFLSSRLGASNIFTMAPDGSNVRSIAPSVSRIYSPLVWSPDGRRIAFIAFESAPSGQPYWVLYAVGADGSELTKLAKAINLPNLPPWSSDFSSLPALPAWSPDNSSLAFLKKNEAGISLYTVGADGSDLKEIHELAEEFTRHSSNITNNLAWSPDGTKILLSGLRAVGVVGVDGSEFRLLTDLPGDGPVFYSTWSPDGSKIAVSTATTSSDDSAGFYPVLYTMNADGSNKRILAKYVVEVDYTKYGADVRYQDKRVEPAHGEAWPAHFDPTFAGQVPATQDLPAATASALEVPRVEPRHGGSWPMEFEEFGDPNPESSPLPGEGMVAFEVLPITKNSTPPGPFASTDSPCTKHSGGDCTPRDVSGINLTALSIRGSAYGGGEASTVEDVFEKGLFLLEASAAHIAVRGTPQDDSLRCPWRGVARTAQQREDAIRFWLGLGEDEALPSPVQVEADFMSYVNQMSSRYRDYVGASYKAISRGGLSNDIPVLTCYADYAVQEYLLGSGPSIVTVAYDLVDDTRSYDLYRLSHAAGEFGPPTTTPLMSGGEYAEMLGQIIRDGEEAFAGVLDGRENVIFFSPMGAHNAIAVEAWQAVAQWDLQTDDEGTVFAVRYGAHESDPEYTQTLVNLKSRVTTAAASDDFADDRIENVSGLTQYYRDIGAYDDITPDDGSTETFTPSHPPPMPDCGAGTAVADSSVNRALVHDCKALLDLKDTLSGTATLNWSKGIAIGTWTGVTVSGTPQRVTGLGLPSSSLNGSMPAGLGTLWGLTTLDLSGNSLTGMIPAGLGDLPELATLKLSGNSLSGCIPPGLRDVATNDLASVGLSYCDMLTAPPAPSGLSLSVADGTFTISWDEVSGVTKYEAQYTIGDATGWTALPETESVSTTHAPGDGLPCGTAYRFRVRAFGDGVMHSAEWGTPSSEETHATEACNQDPVFDPDSYEFTVDEDAAVGDNVGTVTASDLDEGDTVSYSISSGNEAGQFSIDYSTGDITVVGALDYETTTSYTLTVEADDAKDGTDTATVNIAVGDVAGVRRILSVTKFHKVPGNAWSE